MRGIMCSLCKRVYVFCKAGKGSVVSVRGSILRVDLFCELGYVYVFHER